MQKKKLYQLAAAIVLVVAVAAALILTGMRKSTPVSEAQASSVPSSALPGGEAEKPSSAAASSESAVGSEVTEESPGFVLPGTAGRGAWHFLFGDSFVQ